MQHSDWSNTPGHFPALKVVVYVSSERVDKRYKGFRQLSIQAHNFLSATKIFPLPLIP